MCLFPHAFRRYAALDRGRGDLFVETIITLARKLGTETVAEGVEAAAQVHCLRNLGAIRCRAFCMTGRCLSINWPAGSNNGRCIEEVRAYVARWLRAYAYDRPNIDIGRITLISGRLKNMGFPPPSPCFLHGAAQQVAFLRQIVERKLPFNGINYDTLKRIMLTDETGRNRLYAKTGWATRTTPSVGWYAGYVETPDDIWLFALNIAIRDAKDLPLRSQIAKDALKAKGVLPTN